VSKLYYSTMQNSTASLLKQAPYKLLLVLESMIVLKILSIINYLILIDIG
jgi:hypothetical protein